MLSELAKNEDYLRAAEIIQRAENTAGCQDFMNQIEMNPFDIIFMFLILPIMAVTVGWIILKGASNNGKNQQEQ